MELHDIAEKIRTLTRRRGFRYGASGGLLVLSLFCLTGGASETVKKKARNYELSAAAQRVSDLLDHGAYGAAQGILDTKLPQHPDDAGLHVQYARWLVLSRSVSAPNFVQTPLSPVPNAYWAPYVADEAGRRAVQLDPGAKAYSAAVLMTALHEKVAAALEQGDGVIGDGVWEGVGKSFVVLDELQASSLKVGWTALELDPPTAAAFKDDFRQLVEKSVKLGKISSAAMLGNLAGSLEDGGLDGRLDFDFACDAFERALVNYEAPKEPGARDWINVTIKLFRSGIFKTELDAVAKGDAPTSYRRLEEALNEHGYAIIETAEFEQVMKERKIARQAEDERRRREAQAPRIAELKERFAAAVFEQCNWDESRPDSWNRETHFFNNLQSAFHGSGFAFTKPSTVGFEAERELRQMQAFPSDLRKDPRVGWALSSGSRAIEYWSPKIRYGIKSPKPSSIYAAKMQHYLSPLVVHRRLYGEPLSLEDGSAEKLAAEVDELIRYDAQIGKYLVRRAELPLVRLGATGRWYGPFWMTTLAEIAHAVEEGEAIVFDENGQPLQFGKHGLIGYLLSLEVEEPKENLHDPSLRILGPKPQVDFEERFPQYVAAVGAGRDPAAGLDAAEHEKGNARNRTLERNRRER